jgi:hypothetical protein
MCSTPMIISQKSSLLVPMVFSHLRKRNDFLSFV